MTKMWVCYSRECGRDIPCMIHDNTGVPHGCNYTPSGSYVDVEGDIPPLALIRRAIDSIKLIVYNHSD